MLIYGLSLILLFIAFVNSKPFLANIASIILTLAGLFISYISLESASAMKKKGRGLKLIREIVLGSASERHVDSALQAEAVKRALDGLMMSATGSLVATVATFIE